MTTTPTNPSASSALIDTGTLRVVSFDPQGKAGNGSYDSAQHKYLAQAQVTVTNPQGVAFDPSSDTADGRIWSLPAGWYTVNCAHPGYLLASLSYSRGGSVQRRPSGSVQVARGKQTDIYASFTPQPQPGPVNGAYAPGVQVPPGVQELVRVTLEKLLGEINQEAQRAQKAAQEASALSGAAKTDAATAADLERQAAEAAEAAKRTEERAEAAVRRATEPLRAPTTLLETAQVVAGVVEDVWQSIEQRRRGPRLVDIEELRRAGDVCVKLPDLDDDATPERRYLWQRLLSDVVVAIAGEPNGCESKRVNGGDELCWQCLPAGWYTLTARAPDGLIVEVEPERVEVKEGRTVWARLKARLEPGTLHISVRYAADGSVNPAHYQRLRVPVTVSEGHKPIGCVMSERDDLSASGNDITVEPGMVCIDVPASVNLPDGSRVAPTTAVPILASVSPGGERTLEIVYGPIHGLIELVSTGLTRVRAYLFKDQHLVGSLTTGVGHPAVLAVPPGAYTLVGSPLNGDGDVDGVAKTIDVKSGEHISVSDTLCLQRRDFNAQRDGVFALERTYDGPGCPDELLMVVVDASGRIKAAQAAVPGQTARVVVSGPGPHSVVTYQLQPSGRTTPIQTDSPMIVPSTNKADSWLSSASQLPVLEAKVTAKA